MAALAIKQPSKESKARIIPVSDNIRLFRKVEIQPGKFIFDFDEDEIIDKFEKLIASFDQAFK